VYACNGAPEALKIRSRRSYRYSKANAANGANRGPPTAAASVAANKAPARLRSRSWVPQLIGNLGHTPGRMRR